MTAAPLVQVYPSLDALAGAAAEAIACAARSAIAARGRFTVALAGGGTPRPIYELLGTAYHDAVDWSRVAAFFGDERCVPPGHADSNFRMAHDALLARVPVGRVHRMLGELAPAEAAERYDAELRAALAGAADGATFDLVLLGVGADGHTASLFPGAPALDEGERWAVAVQAPEGAPVRDRVTLTLPALDAARETVVLCAGTSKRRVVEAVRRGPADAARYPAGRVRALGPVRWLVDEAAAV